MLYKLLIILIIFALIVSLFEIYKHINELINEKYNIPRDNDKKTYISLIGGNENNNEQDNKNDNNNEKQKDIITEFIKKIYFKFPQVGVLNNDILRKHELNEFVYLDKTDGLHVNVLLFDNKIYTIKNNDYAELIINDKKYSSDNKNKISILDGELYNDNIFIFDACYINDEDITNKNYIERMKEAEKLINNMQTNDIFIMKQYNEIKYNNEKEATEIFNNIIEYVNKYDTNKDNINIDGVVFQLINAPYTSKDYIVYKLKRSIMNTIDFKLFYDESKDIYRLYLIGSPYDYIFNRKIKPHLINDYHNIKDYIKKPIHELLNILPKSMLILFDNPYRENCSIFNPNIKIENNCKLPKRLLNDANELLTLIKSNKKEYHNKIIEMAIGVNGWIPLRVRNDKDTPNGYKIGLSNCETIFAPVSFNKTYFTKKTTMDKTEIIDPYHEVNKIIRKYIIERCINKRYQNKKLKILDLCGGRGADALNLYKSGAYDICVVDADNVAITQYINRIATIKQQAKNNKDENITKYYKENIKTDFITINGRKYILNENNDELIKEILNINENHKQTKEQTNDNKNDNTNDNENIIKYDIILMNYALHYLCYNYDCIHALNKLISSLLDKNGIFICSYFDGEKIYKDIKQSTNNKLPLKTFKNIYLIEDIKDISEDNKNKFNICKDSIWCNMALPTIDETGYREEPLVTEKFINKLTFIDNEKETLKKIENFYPLKEIMQENKEMITKITNYNNVSDYLEYIKVSLYSLI